MCYNQATNKKGCATMQTVKKWCQWLVTFIVTILVSTAFSPIVQAQEQSIDLPSLITNIHEANKEIESMAGKLTLDLNVDVPEFVKLESKIQGDFQFNVSPRFSAKVVGSADITTASPVLAEDGSVTDEMETNTNNQNIDVTIVDGILYAYDGSAWTVEDISELEQIISQEVTKVLKETQAKISSDSVETLLPLYEKYYDITQTDNEYVFTMKKDIDKEAFWADIEAVSGENIREQVIKEVEAELDRQGESFTPEEKEIFVTLFYNILDLLMDQVSNTVVAYDSATYKLTRTEFIVHVTSEELAKALEPIATSDVPEGIVIDVTYVINYYDHGKDFDIVVPAEAPTFEESTTESSEESAETDSSEATTGEESEPVSEETSTEETESTDETSEATSESEESSEN